MTESAKNKLDLWAEEQHQDILQLRYRVERTLFSEESEFQQIDIVETTGFGRMLFNDSIVMISERDEFIYHEMIAHPAMFVHPEIRRALVIGGGDGGTVRELLRHASVEHIRLVEIDPMVLKGCREHIPLTAAALDDSRVEVTVADGVAFVAETAERYDLVIVDSTDPIGPATPLFGEAFYRNVARVLCDGGVVVSQAESCFYELERQQSMLGILSATFRNTQIYNYVNLTYPGGLWSFSFATKGDLCPLRDYDPTRVVDSELKFRYYSAEMHRAAFVLPQFQKDALGQWLTGVS